MWVKTFFFVLGYKYSKRQKIFPCLYAYSFKNHIDNQMIISITPDLKHYPRGVLSRILFFFLFWLFFIAFLFIKPQFRNPTKSLRPLRPKPPRMRFF